MKEDNSKKDIKLDKKDKRILYELDINSRQTYSEIGKKVGLKKDVVRNRIERLTDKGVILGYMTLVNTVDLGLTVYKIYFKFKDLNEHKKNEIIKTLTSIKDIAYVTELKGNWELVIAINVNGVKKLQEVLNKIYEKYQKHILDKEICMNVSVKCLDRKYLSTEKDNKRHVKYFGSFDKEIELDKLDIKILKELEINSRLSIVELSKKLNTTPRKVNYRLRRLIEEKIIAYFRPFLDISKLGYEYYKILVRIGNYSKFKEDYFLSHCEKIPNFIFIIKTIGPWDYEIELEVRNFTEAYNLINKLKLNMKGFITDFETLLMGREHKFTLIAVKD